MSAAIPVSFSQGGLLASGRPANSFHLQGKGLIAIEGATVRIEGRARRSFRPGKAVTLEFPLERIRNVVYHPKAVRFEIAPEEPGKANPGFVTLWTQDEAAAASIRQGLGEAVTEEFARATREADEFLDRLVTATPRVFVTPALVAINVVVFLAMAFNGAGIVSPDGEVHVRWGSNFGMLTASGEWWRLFTSMFLHFGIVHLAFNMFALWDAGRLAERLFGNWTFLAIYLLAGISGAALSLLWHPAVNSAGASGAIFGVFGMIAGCLVRKELGIPTTVMKHHWGATVPFIGYNLFIGATVPGIDNAAHLGGLAAGFVMGYALARPLDPERRSYSRVRVAGFAAAVAACVVLGAKPLQSVSERGRAEVGVHEAINSAIEEDRRATEAIREAFRALERKEISPEAAARRVQQDGAMRYAEANKRLTAHQLAEPSPRRERQEALIRYTALRRDANELLAQAVRTNDEAMAERAGAMLEKSNAIARELGGGRR